MLGRRDIWLSRTAEGEGGGRRVMAANKLRCMPKTSSFFDRGLRVEGIAQLAVPGKSLCSCLSALPVSGSPCAQRATRGLMPPQPCNGIIVFVVHVTHRRSPPLPPHLTARGGRVLAGSTKSCGRTLPPPRRHAALQLAAGRIAPRCAAACPHCPCELRCVLPLPRAFQAHPLGAQDAPALPPNCRLLEQLITLWRCLPA